MKTPLSDTIGAPSHRSGRSDPRTGLSVATQSRHTSYAHTGLEDQFLPALRQLLPSVLFDRLPETYVDRLAVERGEASTFPFFDLATAELKAAVPKAPESLRIRVTRERLRRLLATDIDIQVSLRVGVPFWAFFLSFGIGLAWLACCMK